MQGQGVPCVGCTDLLHERGALHTWRARVHPATARTRTPFVCVKEDRFLSEKRDASLAVAVRPGAPPPPIDHTGPKQKLASEISLQRARASFSAPDAAERDVYGGRTRPSATSTAAGRARAPCGDGSGGQSSQACACRPPCLHWSVARDVRLRARVARPVARGARNRLFTTGKRTVC
jgi:hypothetical protein